MASLIDNLGTEGSVLLVCLLYIAGAGIVQSEFGIEIPWITFVLAGIAFIGVLISMIALE